MSELSDLSREAERYARSIGSAAADDTKEAALARVFDALQLGRRAEEMLAATARAARDSGCTWQEIGDVVGVTRQAAFQRFGKPIDPRTGEPMVMTTIPHADVMARDVVERIRAADWGAVVSRFDTPMSAALGESGLADAWASMIALSGEVETVGDAFVRRHGLHTVVDLPVLQEAGELVCRIAFDDDGQIAGLFFLNPEAARETP